MCQSQGCAIFLSTDPGENSSFPQSLEVAAAVSPRGVPDKAWNPPVPSPVRDVAPGPLCSRGRTGRALLEPPLPQSLCCDVLVPLKAPLLTQGWEKQEKCGIDMAFREKRLVLMKERLPTMLWEQG